jgi:hypothetical protein
MTNLILDLPIDIFNIIYGFLAPYYRRKLLRAKFYYNSNKNSNLQNQKYQSNLVNFYNWNTPRKIYHFILKNHLLNIYSMKNMIDIFRKIRDNLFNERKVSEDIVWKGEKIGTKLKTKRIGIERIFWNEKLDRLLLAKDFLVCGCTPNCWRCKKTNYHQIKKSVGSIAIVKCREDKKYYPGLILHITHFREKKMYVIQFNEFMECNPIAPTKIQLHTPEEWLENIPKCWLSGRNWNKGIPLKNGEQILDPIYEIPTNWIEEIKDVNKNMLGFT